MSSLESKYKLGFRFHPTDEELINYLKNFVLRGILPPKDLIKVADVFEDSSGPWQIINEDSGGKVHYFLSRLNRFKNSSKKFVRTAGKGTWKGQNSGDRISDGLNKSITIGYKRSLKYHNNIERDQNDKWLMKEYFLAKHVYINKNRSNEDIFVICKIKNKKKREKNNNTDDEVKEEDVDEYIDHILGSNYDNHQVITNDDDKQLGFANEVNNEDYGEGCSAEYIDHQDNYQVINNDDDHQLGYANEVNNEDYGQAEYINHQDNYQVISNDDDNQLGFANKVNNEDYGQAEYIDHQDNYQVINNDDDHQLGFANNDHEANISTCNNGNEVYGEIKESNGIINPYENYSFESLVKLIDF